MVLSYRHFHDLAPYKRGVFSLLIICGGLILGQTVLAQTNLNEQERLPEPELRESLPPLDELLPELDTPSSSPDTDAFDVPETIVVQKFRVVGSTVFESEEFDELLAEFTGEPISFAQLLQAQEAITQKYVEAGYITSGAYIPPQTLENDVVEIQVIEGSVEEINISGLQRLRPGYVRNRLAIAAKTPVNRDRLLEDLQVLQLDPLIQNLSVELAAGIRPGSSILDVTVVEADAFNAIARIDNQRSPSVGSVRRQVGFTHRNLLGFGDRLNFSYINTEGSDSLDNLGYTFPINARNGTLGFRHSRTDSSIIEDPFTLIDIVSESQLYEVSFRQPVRQTPTEEIALGLNFTHQNSQTFILGDIGFPLSNGANDDGITKVSALRFVQEYTKRNDRQVFALRSQFNVGVDVFNATINSGNEPDSQFLSWRGQSQYLRLLAPDTTLLVRGDVQFAGEPLVPLEQFSIGGAASVRGYRQDALLADNGVFASVELRKAIATIPNWDTTLELTPFLDFGSVWNHDDNEATVTTNQLWSVGVGLRLLVGDDLNARIDWGIPLNDLETTGNTLQEDGVYFSVEYNFL
ncbi:surface antigen (D15) [[Leptolyngbya] sp. PCC 7376]|uniref:ShlB/FhaC/HecB family hemolysin secretion/activation protein n=1 Tax=[Leptolyngbya] sp. PCC 7376 TaxID=111781 RepID=UPI00029F1A99|nr:ShlB/FhaC/HecB family hemolysin secretion/activation protein [[Leptolyngbya] sp. PCC 7376]AFY39105.1 surface antigen (D15) [[Leptolyngbya] sp. PCC 7376]